MVHDVFCTPLEAVIHSVPLHDKVLILGNFNAETNHNHFGFEHVIGNYGSGNANDNSNCVP